MMEGGQCFWSGRQPGDKKQLPLFLLTLLCFKLPYINFRISSDDSITEIIGRACPREHLQLYLMSLNRSFFIDQDDLWTSLLLEKHQLKQNTSTYQHHLKLQEHLKPSHFEEEQTQRVVEAFQQRTEVQTGEEKALNGKNTKSQKKQFFQMQRTRKESTALGEEETEEKWIFQKKTIRKQGKKNTNIPKFFVRIFIKYFKLVGGQIPPKLLHHFTRISKQLSRRKTNNFNITDLLTLIKNQNTEFQVFNRETMIKILQRKLKSQILENSYISSNQKTYLMASKIYSIRSRSSRLIKRVQYR